MKSTIARRMTAALGTAGIALAAFAMGAAPQALAAPNEPACTNADAGNALTRAGQINAATTGPSSGAPMTCQPAASHG